MIVARRIAVAVLACAAAAARLRAADDPRLIPKPREVSAGDLASIAKSVTISGAANDDVTFHREGSVGRCAERKRGVRVARVRSRCGFRVSLLRLDTPARDA